ncbi:hypothetical protein FBULB1_9021 [Fusarium bulbicola]|nr:hypothetical protein FBULB1_9021 [Fusarium bulbicola]
MLRRFGYPYLGHGSQSIPWNAHGKEVLTIKLALWSLIVIATSGDRAIGYSYPPLDSWRYNGKGFVHNTSGATKAELSQGDHLLLEPHDMSWQGGAHDTQTQDADDLPQPTLAGGECTVDPSEACQRDDLEASVGGSSRQADQGQDDDDQKTEVGSSHRQHKRKKVRIEKHLVTRKLYYLKANGDKVDTSRAQWRKVDGGYELKGRKNIYFKSNSRISLGWSRDLKARFAFEQWKEVWHAAIVGSKEDSMNAFCEGGLSAEKLLGVWFRAY